MLALALFLGTTAALAAEPPKDVDKLQNPSAVVVGPNGKTFVLVYSGLAVIDQGKSVEFATGVNGDCLVSFQQWLFVGGKKGIKRIDSKGKTDVFVPPDAFPKPVNEIWSMAVDSENGTLYVSDLDSRPKDEDSWRLYKIDPKGKVSNVTDSARLPLLRRLDTILLDGASHLLIASGEKLYRLKLADGSLEEAADRVSQFCRGLTWDHYGRLFASDMLSGDIHVIPRPGEKPVRLARLYSNTAGVSLDRTGKNLLVCRGVLGEYPYPTGSLTSIPISIPGWEVDEKPMPLQPVVAFPDLKWEGWKGETDSGKQILQRPIVLTHAGDGSNRVFLATQHGVIHVFPNDQKATKAPIFLDIQDRVSYNDNQNEEGFLGLAFHPKFKENGEFFVFYTTKKAKLTNVVSRFRVRKDDPSRADPNSEEQIMEFKKPFWNHDGGTLCFGPDGYLYLTHGDGGAANDPYDNAQNMNRWLGKVLRIDVDSADRISKQKNYAVPKDNPFVGTSACPEIWACGLRNVWRMSFDRATSKLWAADVGQNLYEEIDIIEKGGNYGWNRREGLHPFGPKGSGPKPEFIEPIWEYHHDVGKSIIGGHVYRGPRLPELTGHYIYGDYVTGRIWALRYDEAKKRVVANRPIKDKNLPMFSFGEDEKGEVYMLTPTLTGQGIFWFGK
jgi:glucose/arabinose dehydrogenase